MNCQKVSLSVTSRSELRDIWFANNCNTNSFNSIHSDNSLKHSFLKFMRIAQQIMPILALSLMSDIMMAAPDIDDDDMDRLSGFPLLSSNHILSIKSDPNCKYR